MAEDEPTLYVPTGDDGEEANDDDNAEEEPTIDLSLPLDEGENGQNEDDEAPTFERFERFKRRIKLARSEIKAKRNTKIGIIEEPSSQYVISCTIRPKGTTKNYGNIMTFTNNATTNCKSYGDRSPGIWLCPDSYTLYVAQGSASNPNHYIESSSPLKENEDNFVEIFMIGEDLTLYVNGAKNGRVTVPLDDRPPLEELMVYLGDPLHDEADAVIKNLEYNRVTSVVTFDEDPDGGGYEARTDNQIGIVENPSSEYIVSCIIHPRGTTFDGWANILNFTNDPESNCKSYGDRSPGVWFSPGSRTLYVAQGSASHPNHYLESSSPLKENEDNTVEIVVIGDEMTLYVNGENNGEIEIPLEDRPALDRLMVYVGDALHEGADVVVKDLKYIAV